MPNGREMDTAAAENRCRKDSRATCRCVQKMIDHTENPGQPRLTVSAGGVRSASLPRRVWPPRKAPGQTRTTRTCPSHRCARPESPFRSRMRAKPPASADARPMVGVPLAVWRRAESPDASHSIYPDRWAASWQASSKRAAISRSKLLSTAAASRSFGSSTTCKVVNGLSRKRRPKSETIADPAQRSCVRRSHNRGKATSEGS